MPPPLNNFPVQSAVQHKRWGNGGREGTRSGCVGATKRKTNGTSAYAGVTVFWGGFLNNDPDMPELAKPYKLSRNDHTMSFRSKDAVLAKILESFRYNPSTLPTSQRGMDGRKEHRQNTRGGVQTRRSNAKKAPRRVPFNWEVGDPLPKQLPI